MQQIEWINRDKEQKVSFVFDESASAIRAMIESDATEKVGPAIARAIAVSAKLKDETAFDIATQASEEMAVRMGHTDEQAKAATQMLKAKYF